MLAVYKKTSKKNLEDDIEKKMEGDLQILVLAKLGKSKSVKQTRRRNSADFNEMIPQIVVLITD